MAHLRFMMLSGLLMTISTGVSAGSPAPVSPAAKQEASHLDQLPPVTPGRGVHVDRSGRAEQGEASFYANRFANHKMADGRKLNPQADVAASTTLPLGSVAKVTDEATGKSTTVRVEDRGPYVDGRIIDLTPKAADRIDLNKQGVAPVVVKPITEPTPNGGVKLGAGAAEVSPAAVDRAVRTTEALAPPVTQAEAAR